MRRPLSIGAKWTLRYAAVMILTVSAFLAYVYDRIEQSVEEDVNLVLDLELSGLLAVVNENPDDPDRWRDYAALRIDSADRSLWLGFQVFDRDGKLIFGSGSVGGLDLGGLPEALLSGRREQVDNSLFLDRGYPFQSKARGSEAAYGRVFVYTRPFARSATRIRDAFISAMPLLLVLTAALGWWLSRGSLRPIAEITETARRISTTRLDQTIPTTGSGDELDELAHTLNEMIARIGEGVDRIRRFSVDAAHQLRTPLAALRGQIDVTLAKPRSEAEYRAVLEDLIAQVGNLSETVNGMLRLAQSEGGVDALHRRQIDLDALLEEVVEFFGPLAEERELKLLNVNPTHAVVEGDPIWLHQLFANLVHNAIRYTPNGGRVEIDARRDGRRVRVLIRDTGVGMTANETDRVFGRFERGTAPSPAGDAGLGLGLTLAREIARAHGGAIEVESHPGAGSTFAVSLPLAPPEDDDERTPAPAR